jgi:hypothetical protein
LKLCTGEEDGGGEDPSVPVAVAVPAGVDAGWDSGPDGGFVAVMSGHAAEGEAFGEAVPDGFGNDELDGVASHYTSPVRTILRRQRLSSSEGRSVRWSSRRATQAVWTLNS